MFSNFFVRCYPILILYISTININIKEKLAELENWSCVYYTKLQNLTKPYFHILPNFFPNLPIFLHGYIRHIRDISQLCTCVSELWNFPKPYFGAVAKAKKLIYEKPSKSEKVGIYCSLLNSIHSPPAASMNGRVNKLLPSGKSVNHGGSFKKCTREYEWIF